MGTSSKYEDKLTADSGGQRFLSIVGVSRTLGVHILSLPQNHIELKTKKEATMDPSDITNIEIDAETIVSEAVETAKKAFEALNMLLVHSWTQQLVERVSSSAAWQFKVNQEELAALLIDKFRSEIHTVNNPNQTPWSDCLECWSRSVVANLSLIHI